MFLLLRSVCSIRITEPHTTYASITLPRFTTIDSRFKDIKRFQVCRRNGQSIILCHNALLQRAKITELCHWLHFEVLQRLQWSRIIWQRRVDRERVHYHSAHTQSNQSTNQKVKTITNTHSQTAELAANSSSSGDDASFSSVQPLIVCNFIWRVSLNLDTISRKCGL